MHAALQTQFPPDRLLNRTTKYVSAVVEVAHALNVPVLNVFKEMQVGASFQCCVSLGFVEGMKAGVRTLVLWKGKKKIRKEGAAW